MSGVAILVPVNRFDRAKGRLAGLLSDNLRTELALATCRTVAEAAAAVGDALYIVSDEPRVPSPPGATVLAEDPALRGLNPQLEAALARIVAPESGLLILHADLPLATPAALRALVEAAPPAPSVTLVRSSDGGTNAMLLRPPGRFVLAYGPDSHALHSAAAHAAGMAVRDVDLPALALDLDTPADLEALLATPGGAATPSGRIVSAALTRTRSS